MTSHFILAILLCSAAVASAGDVTGTVLVGGRPGASTVVYLEGDTPPAPAATPPRALMDQRNLAFLPGVLPVRRGTVVEFTNSDDVQHNVFTPSTTAGRFNLGTYSRGEARSVTLTEPGEVVVLCNIHMEMEARILVLDGPYFALTSASGEFRIAGLAPGTYTLRLWREGWLPQTRTVTVGEGIPVEVRVEVPR